MHFSMTGGKKAVQTTLLRVDNNQSRATHQTSIWSSATLLGRPWSRQEGGCGGGGKEKVEGVGRAVDTEPQGRGRMKEKDPVEEGMIVTDGSRNLWKVGHHV